MTEILKVDLNSKDIKSENINRLKELFPEIVTEGKIDFDKLKLTLGEEIDLEKEKYGMMWAGKARCFQIIQDRTTGTLKPVREESVDFDTTKNLFIEGDNLEVLKILQKSYFEKIKMIYIDPPYNTGKDFVYKDKFGQQLEEYLKLTNQVDSEGKKLSTNTDSDGRYHSNWMNMMYPRLYLARNLLKEDGVIFISIDDNEVDNLKKICNEIFGEENFVGNFIWKNKAGGGGKQGGNRPGINIKKKEAFVLDHEYIVVYANNITEILRFNEKLTSKEISNYSNPDNDPRGPYKLGNLEMMMPKPISTMYYKMIDPDGIIIQPKGGRHQWRFCEERTKLGLVDGSVVWVKSKCNKDIDKRGYKYVLKSKQYLYNDGEERTKIARSILLTKGLGADGTREIMEILGQKKTEVPIFSNPKPTQLLKYLIKITNTEGGSILDFFAGSATTAHAVLDLNKEDNGNRKFICVQLPEATAENSEAFKAGYKNICEIGKERIRRVIQKIKEEQKQQKLSIDDKQDLGFKVFKLDRSNFKTWDGFTKDIQTTLTDNIEQIKKSTDKDATLYELLLKEGFSLTEDINKFQFSDKQVYSINVDERKLLICLEDKLTLDLFKEIKKLNPTKVIVLDKGFNENDQLKTNAVELLTKVDNDTNKKEYLLKAI
jgi:adenine-specific DNA-methyltransferase